MSAQLVMRALIAVALAAFAAGAAGADTLKPGATNLGTGVAKGLNPRVQVLKPGAAAKTLALPRKPAIPPDQVCATSVRSTVRWDPWSDANWPPTQLNLLCGGAPDTQEPGVCFNRVMNGDLDSGWSGINAVQLCKGTHNSTSRISCFRIQTGNGQSLRNAIAHCSRVD